MAKELLASLRKEIGSRQVNRLRRKGLLPAVVYKEGQPATPVSVDTHALAGLVRSGERIVTLKVDGREAQALIKDVQYDPFGEHLLHADFNELRAGQKVRVRVTVGTKGVPKGHADGGVLNHALHHLEIECLPTAIPERIVLDVEALILGQAIHVSDVKLPEGVVVLHKPTDVVVACIAPRKEEEVAAPAEGAPLEPEVIMEKKPEEGEAATAGEEKKGAEAKKPEAKKPEAKEAKEAKKEAKK